MNDDGVYPIEVDGSPLDVYCDMTTDGGGWTQLSDQIGLLGFPSKMEWIDGLNQDSPNQGQYSILNLIDAFVGMEPGFEFRIDWEEDRTEFVQWKQDMNPFDGRGTVTEVTQVPGGQLGFGTFSGLGSDADSYAALDGNLAGWFWAVGTSAPFDVDKIPAFNNSFAGPLSATRARLWVR
jgi:hypothetical protein